MSTFLKGLSVVVVVVVVVVVFDVVVVVVVDVVDNVALSRVGHPGCIKVVHAKQFVMILCYDRC